MQTLEWMADCLALVILMVGVVLRYRTGDNLPGFLRFREPDESAPPAPPRQRSKRPAGRRSRANRHA